MLFKTRTNQAFHRLASSPYPFSLALRWVVVIGVALRVGFSYLQWENFNVLPWLVALIVYGCYSLMITILIVKRPARQPKSWLFMPQFCVDTFFCSLFYYLSGNVDSDLFLNYVLPIVLILDADFDSIRSSIFFLLVCAADLIALTLMASYCQVGCTYRDIILRGFLPRAIIAGMTFLYALTRSIRLQDRSV